MRFWPLLYLVVLISIAASAETLHPATQRAMDEYRNLMKEKYILLPHQRNYFAPVSYNFNPNRQIYDETVTPENIEQRGEFHQKLEAEFQISFLVLLAQSPLGTGFHIFGGYTHQSWWQVYNRGWSSPFRETKKNILKLALGFP